MLRHFLTAGVLAFAGNFSIANAQEAGLTETKPMAGLTEIKAFDLILPYGQSQHTANISPTVTLTGIQITNDITSSCPDGATVEVYEGVVGNSRWVHTSMGTDYIFRPDDGRAAAVEQIKIVFTQNAYNSEDCTFHLYAELSSPVPSGHLVGALSYSGGYAPGLSLLLSAPEFVTQFRVEVPAFCQGVEVLEAGSVTEGIYDPATATGGAPNSYLVNRGNGERVGEIRASLNGPAGMVCNLPVYAIGAGEF